MVLKNTFIALIGALFMAWSGVSAADEYRPDQFLGLDLSKAALSPKPARASHRILAVPDRGKERYASEDAQPRAEPMSEARLAVHEPNLVIPETRVIEKAGVSRKTGVAHLRAEKPRGAARTKLARRHGNPLDAAGVRYAGSGLALQVRRHLQLEAIGPAPGSSRSSLAPVQRATIR